MFVAVCGVHVERDVFAFLIEVGAGRASQALGQGGLAFKLVRKLPGREHCLGMLAGRLTESGIEYQRGRSNLGSRFIRKIEKLLFGLRIVVAERNIRSSRRRLQSRSLRGLAGSAILSFASSHGARRRPHRSCAQRQHKRYHDSSIDCFEGSWHQLVPTQLDPGKDLSVPIKSGSNLPLVLR
jgi:hypothetical protein